MFDDLLETVTEILGNMSTIEWLIAIGLALILGVAVVQQLAKTALIVVALIAVGIVLMHGRIENWSF